LTLFVLDPVRLSVLNLLDPHSLLAALGAAGVFVILFAETGLLIGFFLPGDSSLFTAGLLGAVPLTDPLHLSLPVVLLAAAAGAVLGAQVGCLIGARAGPALLDRADRPRLQGGVNRARASLERYGTGKAIVLARFIPVVAPSSIRWPARSGCRCGSSRCGRWSAAWCGPSASLSPGTCWAVGSPASTPTCCPSSPFAVVIVVSLIPLALEVLRSRRRPAGQPGPD